MIRNVTLSPTCYDFAHSNAFVRCIVGPIGSGKTSACSIELLRRSKQQAPGKDGVRRTRWLVVRNSYRELKDTTRKTFEDWAPDYGTWREQDFTWTLQAEDVHNEILFRSLDNPKDVKKLLSLELTGAYINEAREIPKHVFDMVGSRVGRYPSKRDGGCTWSGVWMDTNPWPRGHWMHRLLKQEPPPGFELFEQPDGLSPQAENVENLPADYYQRLMLGKDSEWIDTYVRGHYPKSDVGSYYGALLAALERRGGLAAFEHETDGVFTSWDLGHSDSTAIWFWRFRKADASSPANPLTLNRLPEFVDHYESHGQPMSHYFAFLEARAKPRGEVTLVDGTPVEGRGYQCVKHWLPHDARAKTLQTGQSILDMCLERWGASLVEIVPQLSVEDGIQAVRWLLEQDIRIHPRCSQKNNANDTDGVECLRSYRKRWNEELKVYSDTPLHDFASHSADAFRMGAVVIRQVEQITRPPKKPEPPKVRSYNSFTLNELWGWAEEEQRGRRNRIP